MPEFFPNLISILQEVYQRYKDVEFKIGEDDEGHKIRVKLKYFFEYLIFQKDDSPLYLFESSIEDIKGAADMIKHYEVPKYFRDDLFKIVEKKPFFLLCIRFIFFFLNFSNKNKNLPFTIKII